MKKIKPFLHILFIALVLSAVCPSAGLCIEMGFSAAERNWLQTHPRVRIGVDPAYAPYSFRDEKGRYRGIAMEFMGYLSQQLGIEMEVISGLSWPQIVTGIRERRLDVVATMSHRPEREALSTFKESPNAYDLVISDMTMPYVSGLDLAQSVLAERSDMPIVICTGFSEMVNRIKAVKSGIRGVIMKPVLKNEIAKTVREALDGR